MIRLSRLNGKEFILNCELIKYIEATPDTIITLTTGEKIMVREAVDDVVSATVRYRQQLYQGVPLKAGD
ncbi:MAG: flagellar protein FlbD [Bdellovibrionales bacterium GWB1_55_8]|nr:MAG: flagellar protein FlbD [Bdellovibrionales bacterium GWB1_55_8]